MTPEEYHKLKIAYLTLRNAEVHLIDAIRTHQLDTALAEVAEALIIAQEIDSSVRVSVGDRQTARVELRFALHSVEAKLGNHVWKLRKSFRSREVHYG
jgi:hypothetical protein